MPRSTVLYCIIFLLLPHDALWRQNRVQVSAQDIPTIECPNHFGYLRYGDEYIARITVPNIVHGTTHLDVQLTQRQPVLMNYYGKLSLFENQESTLNNINSGRPISYRLDFPIPNILPKLQRISVNGDIICASSDPPLDIVFNLQHNLNTPVQPFSAVSTESTSTAPPSIVFADAITPPPVSVLTQSKDFSNTTNAASQQKKSSPQCSISIVKSAIETTSSTVKRKLVNRGEYPWLVAVYEKVVQGRQFLCTGSLISMRTIISVARCFLYTTVAQVVVHLGQYDLKETFEDERSIENLIIHPEYNITEKSDADVAILQMSTPTSFTDYISPICLWNEPPELSRIVGQMGYIVGWHVLEDYSRDDDNNLKGLPKLVKGAVASNEDCLRSNPIYSYLISARTICAGNLDGSGPCRGDTGAGLMLNRDGVWLLRAIVSYVYAIKDHCSSDNYIVYTDLAKHSAWVQSNLV